jgi:hypothetical protein
MTDLSLEDVEFIKMLANSESVILQVDMNEVMRYRLDVEIGMILREYYKENTMDVKTGWIEKFKKVGITENEGKSAIACARRLGIEIS